MMTIFKKPIFFLALAAAALVLTNCNRNSGGKNPPSSLDMYEVSFQYDGLNRSAHVHIPENYDSSFALPVVLNFHGYGGNAAAHAATTGMTATSDSFQFLLVYPQGSLLGNDPHWNNALPGPDNKSDAEDLGFTSELLRLLDSAFLIDRERVYACGYSNGGMMSYALGCYLNNEIAAVASISGCLGDTTETCELQHPTAALNIHGTNDDVVAYDGGSEIISAPDAVAFWAAQNNAQTPPPITQVTPAGTIKDKIRNERG
ncbi:MAG: hypothetical protein L7S65_00675, partial [Schleiferiaceae bacterium]|nr:hypothetical protein [Schleiferiaceae bacterium]